MPSAGPAVNAGARLRQKCHAADFERAGRPVRFQAPRADGIHAALTGDVILSPDGDNDGTSRMLNVVRGSVLAMLVALMLGAVVAYLTPAGSATSEAPPADLQVEIGQSIDRFFAAVMSGEPAEVRAVLAPEFQIMRADGSTYDAAGYANQGLPVIAAVPEIDRLVVTAHGDLAVAAYYVDIDQTRDGVRVAAHAPRLSVFRKEAGTWLMVAHGNFAALEQ